MAKPKKLGAPPKPQKDRKTRRINVWVTPDQHDLAARAADKAGDETSVWARKEILRAARAQLGED